MSFSYSSQFMFMGVDKITPIIRKIRQEAKAMQKQMQAIKAKNKIMLDTRQARQQLRQMQAMARQVYRPQSLKLDTKQAHNQIRALRDHYAKTMATPAKAGFVQGNVGKVANVSAAKAAAAGGAAGGFGIGALAAGFGGFAAVDSALELGKAETELKKFTGLTGKELDALKQKAFDLESVTGYSAASIMGMMTEASKAGVATEKLASDVMFAAQAGIAFDMSANDAAEAIIHLRSSFFAGQDYETQQKGLHDLAAMISYVADNSASSEPYLVNFMQRAAAVAQVMGASKESLTAVGATFEAIGIAPEVAARAMNSAQTSMVKLAGDAKTLSTLGLNPKQFRKDIQTDIVGSMMTVIAATEKLDKLTQTELLIDIFGQGFADELVRAGAARAIYNDNLALSLEKEKQEASFIEAYNIQMKGLNASWNRAKNGLKSVLGVAIAPYLKGAADGVATLMEWLKNHQQLVKFAAGMIALATGFKVAKMAFSGLTGIFGRLMPLLGKFLVSARGSTFAMGVGLKTAGIFSGKLGFISTGLMALTSPLGIATAGIAALSGGMYLAMSNSTILQEQFSLMGQDIMRIASDIGSGLMQLVRDMGYTGDASELLIDVGTALGIALGLVVTTVRALIAGFETVGRVLGAAATFNFDNIVDAASEGRQKMLDIFGGFYEQVDRALQDSADRKVKNQQERRIAEQQLQNMQSEANAVSATKADASVKTGIQTSSTPAQIEAAKASAAQQKVAADTSRQAADTSKAAADASKQAADSQKSSADRISQAANQMVTAANQMLNASSKPLTVNFAGSGGMNLGNQGR